MAKVAMLLWMSLVVGLLRKKAPWLVNGFLLCLQGAVILTIFVLLVFYL